MDDKELSALLQSLLNLPSENEYVEFKHNNYKPEEVGKRISALANGAALIGRDYGYLVFGIEDTSHQVLGTSFEPLRQKIGNEDFAFWLSRMLSPSIDFRIYNFEYQDKKIVLFHIPASRQRPTLFQNQAYIRVGSYTKLLRDFPEKEQKLWQKPATDYELEYAKRAVSAAEVVALLDTQMVFDDLLKMPYPTNQKGVLSKLEEAQLVVKSNGHFHITNLGALLFAKDLNAFDLGNKAVRVIKYKGNNKLHTEKDQTGIYGYAKGFTGLMSYILGLLPSNEVIEVAIRKEISVYPPLALRELIANAIIHQDFRESGTYLSVEIYDNRIEISNPGLPIVEPLRFIDSYKTRNPLLAKAMRRMGFCEEKGSGVDKVILLCEFFQLPAPDFRTNEHQTVTILFAPQRWEDMNKKDKIRAVYQHCCLMYISKEKMSTKTLKERFKLSPKSTAAAHLIKTAVNEGLIKPEQSEDNNFIPYWA